MRITFSTKPLYNLEQIEEMLQLYEHLHTNLVNLSDSEKVQKEQYISDVVNSLYVSLKKARKCGLRNTKSGEELCRNLESLLKDSFKPLYNRAVEIFK